MNMEDIKKGLMNDSEFLQQYKEQLTKAAETVSTSTWDPSSRSVFSPENLEEEGRILAPTQTPIRNRLPRTPGKGEASAWHRLTSKLHHKPGAQGAGTDTAVVFADAGAPNETSQTYDVQTAAYKLLGRKVEVGGLAIAASQGGPWGDQFDHRRRVKMKEVMLGEEELIISGDKDSSALEFDGLTQQITTNSGNAALATASGIGSWCETLFDEGASPTLFVANARQLRALADDLQGSGSIQRIVVDNQGNGVGGVKLSKVVNPVDGTLIDVEPSRYVGGNAFLLTERSPAGEVYIDMQDLIPMSQVDVPSSNFSSISFVVEATVLRVMGEPYQMEISGLDI